MTKYLYILGAFLFVFQIDAQTTLKLMSYNLLHYPKILHDPSGAEVIRKDDLKYILTSYQPDIFMACEVEDGTGADEILNYCLGTDNYDSSYFTYNHSGSYHLQQMLYFNKHKFDLVDETYLVTYIRDINHYTLKLKTTDSNPDNAIYLDVYVTHLKASSGVSNENTRKDMVDVLVDDLHNIPTGHFVIFAGDFNLYSSDEPAYQDMINPNNAIVFHDPLNRPGNWHNNINFKDIDTQSTHSVSENDYVGGGLDDRFDFIMISSNLINSPALHYVSGTYGAYGNNGTCFNKAINSSYCQGTTYDYTLRQHLYQMSDHMPVVMQLETPGTLAVRQEMAKQHFSLEPGNMLDNYLKIHADTAQYLNLNIINTTGQVVLHLTHYHTDTNLNVSNLTPGMYYLQVKSPQYQQVIKFVKTD